MALNPINCSSQGWQGKQSDDPAVTGGRRASADRPPPNVYSRNCQQGCASVSVIPFTPKSRKKSPNCYSSKMPLPLGGKLQALMLLSPRHAAALETWVDQTLVDLLGAENDDARSS